MKITGFETFIVPPRWLFLKIETDEGISGWGEPVVEGKAHTVQTAVEELMDYLIGQDPSGLKIHGSSCTGRLLSWRGYSDECDSRDRSGLMGY